MERMPLKHVRRGTLAALSLLLGAGLTVSASAQSTIAGNYEPSPQRMEVKVSTWGEDCGTRPTDQTINETGKVSVKEEGAHLSMKFATRTLRTNACWSPNPGLTLVSATSANGKYRAECRTAAGDPKREIGRYTATAAVGTLELVEESDYDWQLKSSHCVAKVRVTQTLTSLTRPKQAAEPAKVDASVAQPAAPPPAPPPPPSMDEEKCVPGPAARLRMRPSDARIAPGERVCFVIRVVDAAGCPLPAAESGLEVSLQRPTGVQGTLTGSCFKAAENAALAEGLFKVQVAANELHAEATVVVAAPDLSDITARRGVSPSSTGSTAGRSAEAQYETGVRAVAKSSKDIVWLGVGVAVLALLLACGAVLALRAAKKQRAPAPARRRSSLPEPEPRLSDAETLDRPAPKRVRQATAEPVVATGPQRICPKCRRGYPPASERCTIDDELLMDYDDFVAGKAPKAADRHCPECGMALTPDAFFCGACGHKMTVR
jgi:hypothetical protein